MSKTIIRKVPRTLGYANLYLDDLIEISAIVEADFDSGQANDEFPKLSFSYRVDGTYVFTTLEELEEHGGSVSEFTLLADVETEHFGTSSYDVVSLNKSLEISFSPIGLGIDNWGTFSQIEQVVSQRRSRIRTFLNQTLGPFGSQLAVLLTTIILVWLVGSQAPQGVPRKTGLMLCILLWIFWVFFFDFFVGQNKVHLRYHRANQRERERIWKERAGKAGWMVAGALAGTFATLLTQILQKKYLHK